MNSSAQEIRFDKAFVRRAVDSGILDRVPLSEIVEHYGFNARKRYEGIPDLVESIEQHGLQQPLACYRLSVGEDDHEFGVLFLQSGYRRRRALDVIAKKLDDPDLLVDVSVKTYATHDAAKVAALAVDSTGEPLTSYDLADRLAYLIDKLKCTQAELSSLTSIHASTIKTLLTCRRQLHPRILKVWEKAPTSQMEIPINQLVLWAREPQSEQLVLLEAYVNGEEVLDRRGLPKKNKNGTRLDGHRVTRRAMRAALMDASLRLEQGGKPTEIARLEGIARGLRFALGDITKVF